MSLNDVLSCCLSKGCIRAERTVAIYLVALSCQTGKVISKSQPSNSRGLKPPSVLHLAHTVERREGV